MSLNTADLKKLPSPVGESRAGNAVDVSPSIIAPLLAPVQDHYKPLRVCADGAQKPEFTRSK